MSMNETPVPTIPPKKRKAARRKRSAAVPKPAAEFAGLTVTDCPSACNAQGCIISGIGVCAHPRKGGLQGRLMHDNAAIGRLNHAHKVLGKKLLDARFA